jgi:hypothetical protein
MISKSFSKIFSKSFSKRISFVMSRPLLAACGVEKFYLPLGARHARLEVCGALLETFGGLFQKAALGSLRK